MTATWTAPPRDWDAGLFVTAAIMNTHVRDQQDWLKARVFNTTTVAATSTTSTTFVKVTGSDCAITSVGGDIMIAYVGTVWNSATNVQSNYDLAIDGSRVGDATNGLTQIISTNVNFNYAMFLWWQSSTPPSAASHTYSVYWKTASNTLNTRGWIFAMELR